MKNIGNNIFGLSEEDKQRLLDKVKKKKPLPAKDRVVSNNTESFNNTSPDYYQFDKFPEYKQIKIQKLAAEKLNIAVPYFKIHDGIAKNITTINGHEYINYASYDYINLSGHQAINNAAKEAIERYGTTVSASRPVSGERIIHRELEQQLSEIHNTEGSLLFVSGHAANVTTIGCLFNNKDLVIHDSLIHNSIIQGAILSGAKRLSFPHNNTDLLDKILQDVRGNYQKVLIVIEGLYSMEGDIPDLPKIIDIKHKYKALLMVDEAHSIGVVGKSGMGICEHFSVHNDEIDITMGTLSKSLVSCGGYISGKKELIEILKYNAPGFVYSVGIAPSLVASALEAIKILKNEPERVHELRQKSLMFYNLAKENKLDTGTCSGYSIIPIITGNSLQAVKLSNSLFYRDVNVQPIIYPAVEEKSARLRFFLSSAHTELQIEKTISILKEEMQKIGSNSIRKLFS